MGGAPILWMDRTGRKTPLRSMPANWGNPQFSPDGSFASPSRSTMGSSSLCGSMSGSTTGPLSMTTEPGTESVSPFGRQTVATSCSVSNRDVQQNLYWQRADGTGDAQRLTNSEHPQSAASWHPGRDIIAFQETRPQTGADLMVVALEGDDVTGWRTGTPQAFLSTPAIEREPMFSPDGRWLAYPANDIPGVFEVYVTALPGPGGTWLISTDGGVTPTWSRTRRELLYSQS